MRRVPGGMIAGLVLACMPLVTVGTIGQTRQAESSGNPEAKKVKNPVSATPESIAAGRQLYQKFCRFCHGATGKGDGSMAPEGSHPSNMTDDVWEHGPSDGEIFAVIRDGIGPKFDMDGFKGKISDHDMWNLVNYIHSIGPRPQISRTQGHTQGARKRDLRKPNVSSKE